MSRMRTGAALIGAAMAVLLGGTVASAGPDPSVSESSTPESSAPESSAPETSVPDVTVPVETSVPPPESSAPPEAETYTLTIELPAWRPSDGSSTITVGVVVDGTDGENPEYVAGPVACAANDSCATFELAPGDYDLRIVIEHTNSEVSFGLVPAQDSDTGYDVTIVDRDLIARFDIVAMGPALPIPTSTTTVVASGGPVPVAELPETGSNGRLGVASLLLISVGVGCVIAARRRPA